MARPTVKINVSRSQAALIYTVLLLIAACLLFTLFNKQPSAKSLYVLKVIYILFALPFSIYGIITLFSKRFIYKPGAIEAYDREPLITITDEEIVCSFPSKMRKERVRWQDLVKIQVLTTDEGPAECDVFYILLDASDKGVVIPQDKEAESKLILERILKFPGFDHEVFLQAMGHTQVKWFTVWEKNNFRLTNS